MFNPRTNYAKIAYDAILFFISTGQIRKEKPEKISADLKLNRACIVSVYDINNNLRGSSGDVKPIRNQLYDEIVENAINAVSKENQAEPIKSEELSQIKVYVDVLSELHPVDDFNELKPRKHGIFVRDKAGEGGFIIPDVKGINTVEQQINAIKQDMGIKEADNSNLELFFFKSTRYD